MTVKEFLDALPTLNFNSSTDEELKLVLDEMSRKETEVKNLMIRRKRYQIRHPLPKDKKSN